VITSAESFWKLSVWAFPRTEAKRTRIAIEFLMSVFITAFPFHLRNLVEFDCLTAIRLLLNIIAYLDQKVKFRSGSKRPRLSPKTRAK
jgi:hypothetical protein